MKKLSIILFIFILIIVICLCGLTYYKFVYYNADYLIIDISNEKRISNIDYIKEYSQYKYDDLEISGNYRVKTFLVAMMNLKDILK